MLLLQQQYDWMNKWEQHLPVGLKADPYHPPASGATKLVSASRGQLESVGASWPTSKG